MTLWHVPGTQVSRAAIIFSHFLARTNELENTVWTESLGRPGETQAGHVCGARSADGALQQAVKGPDTPLPLLHTPGPRYLRLKSKDHHALCLLERYPWEKTHIL